jgi:sulfur relay (sulfurtransferase) complex TusBCD TusD component (DsrE family)
MTPEQRERLTKWADGLHHQDEFCQAIRAALAEIDRQANEIISIKGYNNGLQIAVDARNKHVADLQAELTEMTKQRESSRTVCKETAHERDLINAQFLGLQAQLADHVKPAQPPRPEATVLADLIERVDLLVERTEKLEIHLQALTYRFRRVCDDILQRYYQRPTKEDNPCWF